MDTVTMAAASDGLTKSLELLASIIFLRVGAAGIRLALLVPVLRVDNDHGVVEVLALVESVLVVAVAE